MLTSPRPRRKRGRRQQSLRQEYAEFILQRIEEFKDQLTREALLAIADEAVRELEVGPQEQLVLTEVLVLEHVDRLIMRRLNLPSFRRWRERHLRLRRAQREPTHWGLARQAPLVELVDDFDESDVAMVVGGGALPAALFLAAHDWPVVFLDQQLTSVEAAESRAAAEALGSRFQGLVVSLGNWFPDVTAALAILDRQTLHSLGGGARRRFVDALKDHTAHGGLHCLTPATAGPGRDGLSAKALASLYPDWALQPVAAGWVVVSKPDSNA